jgi:hypothetical protein
VLPWLPEQQKPVKHVTRYEKSREEREYNIVLGRFREEDKELSYQHREGVQLKRALEKGRVSLQRGFHEAAAHCDLLFAVVPCAG